MNQYIEKYLPFVSFVSTSLISTVLDLLIYNLLINLLISVIPVFHLFIATWVARIFSDTFKYLLDKYLVFHSHAKAGYIKYMMLASSKTLSSSILVTVIGLTGIGHEMIVKCIVDVCLFFPGYFFSKSWVHRKRV